MRIRLIALCLALLPVCIATANEWPLAQRLPAETILYMGWAGRSPTFDSSQLGQLLRDPAILRTVQQIRSGAWGEGSPTQAGAVAARVMALADIAWQRPAAMAATDLRPDELALVLIVELGQDRDAFAAQLAELLTLAGAQPVAATIGEHAFQQVSTGGGKAMTFGFVGSTFILATQPRLAERAAEGPAAASLATSERFQAAMAHVAGENLQAGLYVDLPAARISMQSGDDAADVAALFDRLGLGDATAVAGGMRIRDRGMYTRIRLLAPAPLRGLAAVLAESALEDADLAEAPSDAFFLLAGRISLLRLAEVWTSGQVAAGEGVPPGGPLGTFESLTGLASADELLTSLGGRLMLVASPSVCGGAGGGVLSISVRDADAFQAVRARVEARLRDLGLGLHAMPNSRGSISYLSMRHAVLMPAWAVSRDRLYLGLWPQVVQGAIDHTVSPERRLTGSEAWRRARPYVNGRPTVLLYADGQELLRQTYPLALMLWTLSADRLTGSTAPVTWLPSLPTLLRFSGPEVAAISSDADGLIFESYGTVPGLMLANVAVGARIIRALPPLQPAVPADEAP